MPHSDITDTGKGESREAADCLGGAGHPEFWVNWQQQRREKRFDVEYIRKVKPTGFA